MLIKGKKMDGDCVKVKSSLDKADSVVLDRQKVDWKEGQEVMLVGNNVTEKMKIKSVNGDKIGLDGKIKK